MCFLFTSYLFSVLLSVNIGSPVFSKLDGELARALMSVNAVKAIEIGSGCNVVTMRGSENRDKINKSGFESKQVIFYITLVPELITNIPYTNL